MATETEQPMIKIRNLHKRFGSLEILKGIDLDVAKSEVVVVIGPSGSGKSTLLRCVNYLEVPSDGLITIDGQDITRDVNINTIRAEVGMVFQHFNLFPHMSVLKNITLAQIKVRQKSESEAEAIALELLKRVGLENKADAFPAQPPVVSNSVWLLPARWRCALRSCSLMSRLRPWIRRWCRKFSM